MVTTVTTPQELVRELRRTANGLYAIDGFHGSGKTTLGREVAALLGIPLVQLDDYVLAGRGGFVDFIRHSELSIALDRRPVIVEGVCLLAVLNHMGIEPDAHVYIDDRPPSELSSRGSGPLAAEVLAYHREWRPAIVADLLYVGSRTSEEENSMESRGSEVDIIFIQAKTKLALTLAFGGMLTLLIGLAVLLYGVTSSDQTLIRAAGIEVSASGLGGVIMITSTIWAFFAYRAQPIYRRSSQSSEKYDPETGVSERHENTSATQQLVGPGSD